jgi:hypothetical protein
MAEPFDPYQKWLGIAPADQPPNHYRLLGLAPFEADAAAIDAAASRVRTYLEGCGQRESSPQLQKLLSEVDAARRCLLDPPQKAEYDAQLRQSAGQRAGLTPRTSPTACAGTGRMLGTLLGVAFVAGGIGGGVGWMLASAPEPVGIQTHSLIEMLEDHTPLAELCRQKGAVVQVAVTAIEFDGDAPGAPPITDATLAEITARHINSTEPIRKLSLRGAKITNAGLEYVQKNFDMLESLNLTNCKGITDEGLAHLRLMPTLETLNVTGCDGLTKAGVESLRAAFKFGFEKKDLRVNGFSSLP